MNRRDILRTTGATLATVTVAGCSSGSSEGTRTISMTEGFRYDPDAPTVSAGMTVRWVNDSDIGHTVTAYADRIPDGASYFASGGFDTELAARRDISTGIVDTDEQFQHTLETAGRYEYFCVPHEGSGMVGSVTVE